MVTGDAAAADGEATSAGANNAAATAANNIEETLADAADNSLASTNEAADAAADVTASSAEDLNQIANSDLTPATSTEEDATYPEGLAFRSDLPQHLFGPDGFTGSGQLSGTHNLDNALASLDAQGATSTLKATNTYGISQLRYSYTNASGALINGAKTVYDPAIYSDKTILDMSQSAGQRAFELYLKDPSQIRIDLNQGGVNFRSYINIDPTTGAPYVGNVHPIK